MQLPLLFICLVTATFLTAQDYRDTLVQNGDTTILIDHSKLPDDLPTIHHLSPEEVNVLREQHGIFPVRVVDQPNTYQWNDDGAEGKTVSNEFGEEVAVFRFTDVKAKIDKYYLGFISQSGIYPPNFDLGAPRDVPPN